MSVATLSTVVIPGLFPRETAGFVTYLVYRLGISPRTVERRIRETIQFLAAPRVAGQRKVPSHRVDVVWHAMILHTHWYPKLCAALGHAFIHHYPNDYKGVGRQETEDCNNCNSPAACHWDCSWNVFADPPCGGPTCSDCIGEPGQDISGPCARCENCVACDCDFD